MTEYYTEGIWGGIGPASGELNYLVILEVKLDTYIGDDIQGKCYDPFIKPYEVIEVQSGLNDDKLLGPSVLCKWGD